MHILLTDILTCPRCGPAFGLVVLADAMSDRQVRSGRLGCANCRNEYPIREGVADLRVAGGEGEGEAAPPGGDRAFRLAALSGVAERTGSMLVRGASPELVAEVAALLPNAQLVGAGPAPPPDGGGESQSWVAHRGALPFRDRSLLAAAVVGPPGDLPLADLARVVAPGGRLVLDSAGPWGGASLPPGEWELLLEQDGVAVASRADRR